MSAKPIILKKGNEEFYPVTDASLVQGLDLSTKESTTNKVTSLSSESTNTQYPSAKCVYDALDEKYSKPSGGIPASDIASGVIPDVSDKQDTLVSGTNIKTVNNNSLLGSGNISVGTVTSVKVGTTSYNPSSGMVSLPAYPTVPTAMSASEATTGTSTTARTISASVLSGAIDNKLSYMTQTEVTNTINTIFS